MKRFACLLLLASAAAHAQLVTIDPGAYPTSTNLFSVTAGARVLTLTNENVPGRMVIGPVVSIPNTWAPGATAFFGHKNPYAAVLRGDFRNVFGFEGCLDGVACSPEFFNPLIVTFTVPTNFVEVRVHFLNTDIDGTILRAYNSAGDLLETCRFWGSSPTSRAPQLGTYPTPESPVCGEEIRRYDCNRRGVECKIENLGRIQRGYPDIAYITYGGESHSSTRSTISHVTFRRFSEACAP